MREISAGAVTETVARLCIDAARYLPDDVLSALQNAEAHEASPLGRRILGKILENAQIARQTDMPLCQDTGTTVVYLDIGQDAHVAGGDLYAAVHEGVRRGYSDGLLRKSVVAHPFTSRQNTRDNTPAIIHTDIVPGDGFKITVMPKGGGCENMSYFQMLTPAAGRQGAVDFIVDCLDRSGANPCPPVIVGVGIGGTADKSMAIAKQALLRPVGRAHADPEVAALEAELLGRINALGIGPIGVGGTTTALAVHVETYPCHMASLPVAVNLQCHSARSKSAEL
ncbi:MAG: fumarate hydratase [Chloroflexi bacterium]|nr:fumarate hydratase [Chloroflexota bacterium]